MQQSKTVKAVIFKGQRFILFGTNENIKMLLAIPRF